jgi:hypothetical protein
VSAGTIVINGTTVTVNSGDTVDDVATNINSATITGVFAADIDGKLTIYADSTATADGSTGGEGIVEIDNGSGTPLASLGITATASATYYYAPAFQASPHYTVPRWGSSQTTPEPTGSVWQKTTNVNLWFFMQKVSIVKQAVFLKYGMGMEMYNFRYDSRVSYRKESFPYLYNDSISFSKNKLFAGYLSVPLMLHINTTPGNKKGFSFSAGVSAGYLVGSRVKQKSEERGKQKYKGDFDLSPFRTALIGELGIGPVKLYGSYSLNTLHDSYTRLEQYPFAVGIRFSNW